MTPQSVRTQTPEEIYALLRVVAAICDNVPRLLCPLVLGRSNGGHLRALCDQYGGSSGLPRGSVGGGGCQCLAVDKFSHVEVQDGNWKTESQASRQ